MAGSLIHFDISSHLAYLLHSLGRTLEIVTYVFPLDLELHFVHHIALVKLHYLPRSALVYWLR